MGKFGYIKIMLYLCSAKDSQTFPIKRSYQSRKHREIAVSPEPMCKIGSGFFISFLSLYLTSFSIFLAYIHFIYLPIGFFV